MGSHRGSRGALTGVFSNALLRQRDRGVCLPLLVLILAACLFCIAPPASGDPIFGARVSHMTVPNGADDPKLSVAFWPHQEGVPLPELAPGQESMVMTDGSTGRKHVCIIPNITSTGLPGDEEEEEEQQPQPPSFRRGAGAPGGGGSRGPGGSEGEGDEDEEEEERVGGSGRMGRWKGRRRRSPPKRTLPERAPRNPGLGGLGLGAQGGVAEGDTRKSPEELLDALKGLPCSYKMEGWWTYEFCYKDKIRQLHFEPMGENKLVITMEFVLGLYDAAASLEAQKRHDAALATMPPEDRRGKKRYHVQVYTGGTACDLTGIPRKTQVRFFCDDSGAEGQRGQQQQQPPQHQEPRNAHIIKSLKEAPTCEYEMHFVSSTLCQHRDFQTVAPAVNVINCYELPPPEAQDSHGGTGTPEATPHEREEQGRGAGGQGHEAVEGKDGAVDAPSGAGEGGEGSEDVVMEEDVELGALEEEVLQL